MSACVLGVNETNPSPFCSLKMLGSRVFEVLAYCVWGSEMLGAQSASHSAFVSAGPRPSPAPEKTQIGLPSADVTSGEKLSRAPGSSCSCSLSKAARVHAGCVKQSRDVFQANLPLLQRELLHCARAAKQTPSQYLAQHEHILLNTASSPADSSELLIEVNGNSKRHSPDR